MRRRRRVARLALLAVTGAASGLLLAATPASACQPESCPDSPVCDLLRHAPKLPQCIPVY
jgi:hypothetical protein